MVQFYLFYKHKPGCLVRLSRCRHGASSGDARSSVCISGACQSKSHRYLRRRYPHPQLRFPGAQPPLILDHEIAGNIVEAGSNMRRVAPGIGPPLTTLWVVAIAIFAAGSRSVLPMGLELDINRNSACQGLPDHPGASS